MSGSRVNVYISLVLGVLLGFPLLYLSAMTEGSIVNSTSDIQCVVKLGAKSPCGKEP